jgi:FtsP/CotA-like multicopper oxidase with cupredoxin domain
METDYWIFIIILIICILLIITRYIKIENNLIPQKSAEYFTIIPETHTQKLQDSRKIIEISLTASSTEVSILEGEKTKILSYNGTFPGPLIEAKKGDTLSISYFNDLSEFSNITFHGLENSLINQKSPHDHKLENINNDSFAVEPGGSTTYEVKLSTAGLFYYHCGINSKEHLAKGLFGTILVHDYSEDIAYYNEKVLVFSTLNLNNENQICEGLENEHKRILLTNGVHNGSIILNKNVPIRLRMVNCDADLILKIFLENSDILRVGGDQGLSETPMLIKDGNGLILSPGERADIIFVPRAEKIGIYSEHSFLYSCAKSHSSSQFHLIQQNRAFHKNYQQHNLEHKTTLVTLNTIDQKDKIELQIPLSFNKIKRILVNHCTPVIPIEYEEYSMYKGIPFDSFIKENAPIVFENGTYIIEITNTFEFPNNFYIQGFTFQHLNTIYISDINSNVLLEKVENKILENKDTIYIPPKPSGKNSKTVVRLAIEFLVPVIDPVIDPVTVSKDYSQSYIFQSNILSYAEKGQKGFISIVPESDRRRYLSSPGYINTYSSYFTESSHNVCLTKSVSSSKNLDTSSDSNDSQYSKDSQDSQDSQDSNDLSNNYNNKLLTDIKTITNKLMGCRCSNGLTGNNCSCFHTSKKRALEERLNRKKQ